jgi:hypothetical protein
MYSDLVDIIRTASNEVNLEGSFYHGRTSDINLNSPELPLPQICFFYATITVNGGVDIANNCQLAIIMQDSPHSDTLEREQLLFEADILARKFKAVMEQDYTLTNFRLEPFIIKHSAMTTGLNMGFNIEYKSSKVCL